MNLFLILIIKIIDLSGNTFLPYATLFTDFGAIIQINVKIKFCKKIVLDKSKSFRTVFYRFVRFE